MSIKKLLKIGLVGIVLASPIKDIRAQDTPPPLPSEHWGQVNYNGASSVPDGYSAVIKDSNNVVLGEMEGGTIDGWYDVIAATDNPSTAEDEGAVDGEKTFVFINNYKAKPELIHKSGSNKRVDLEVIVNHPPIISDIPDTSFVQGDSLSFDLDDYVDDPDNTKDELKWSYSGNTNIIVSYDSLTHIIKLSSKDWYGSEEIIYTVKDPGELSDSDTSLVSVIKSPDTIPPEISITYPENDSLYTSHITELKYTLFDENPDSSWYSIDGSLTRIVVPWSSDTTITDLRSKQGENIWYVYASDKSRNNSTDSVRFNVDTTSTGIEESIVPSDYSLKQNYPNPFNSSTIISYSIPEGGPVLLLVYDLIGKKLETLVNEEQTPGSYEVNFSAENLSSGIYFYNLRTNLRTNSRFNKTRKMLLIK